MNKLSKETFIDRAVALHGSKYSYEQIEYVNTKTKVKISCKEHGLFEQSPEKHMAGRGCPKCAKDDFIKQTIKRNKDSAHNLNRDLLIKDYIDNDLSQKQIAEKYNMPESTISTYLVRYNINKDIDKIVKKRQETNIEKYGFKTPAQNPEVSKKMKKTFIQRYGADHPSKVPSLMKKSIEAQVASGSIKVVFGKLVSEWSALYDINHNTINYILKRSPEIKEEDFVNILEEYHPGISSLEAFVIEKLKLNFWNKNPLNTNLNYKPDFKLNDKIYLNVDGLYWHSEINKPKNYHFNMRKEYESAGIRVLQFRGNEVYQNFDIFKSMINNAIMKSKLKIGARKCLVKKPETKEAKEFLDKNHMKGYKNAKSLGLYYKDELVSIMSYKYTKNKILKIERFCSKVDTNVIGAFSKLLKSIESQYSEGVIHYWVDLRYGTGNFLLSQGFKMEKETLGWEWTDFKKTYNRLKCRANMDKRGLSQKEHAEELGWHKIYDAGQRLFIKQF